MTKERLDIPFDLKEVIALNLSQKGLQQVLEFILDNLGELRAQFDDIAKPEERESLEDLKVRRKQNQKKGYRRD